MASVHRRGLSQGVTRRMWIMIAGPYRTGAKSEADCERNLVALNRAAYAVLRKGHVPIVGVNLALPVIQAAGSETYDAVMMPLSLVPDAAVG